MSDELAVLYSTYQRFKKDQRPFKEEIPNLVWMYRDRLEMDPKVIIIRTDEADELDMGGVIRVYLSDDDWIELKVVRYEKPNLRPQNYVLCQEDIDYVA